MRRSQCSLSKGVFSKIAHWQNIVDIFVQSGHHKLGQLLVYNFVFSNTEYQKDSYIAIITQYIIHNMYITIYLWQSKKNIFRHLEISFTFTFTFTFKDVFKTCIQVLKTSLVFNNFHFWQISILTTFSLIILENIVTYTLLLKPKRLLISEKT